MSQRFAASRRRVQSPPGQELLGVITSHGPYRASYQVSQKAGGRPTTTSGLPVAHSPLSAEGMRATFSSQAARQRYCSAACGTAARRWGRWKAQQRYRETATGKEKRNGQSQRQLTTPRG